LYTVFFIVLCSYFFVNSAEGAWHYFLYKFSSAPHGCGAFFGYFQFLFRLTFRLYMTFWQGGQANRRFAALPKCGGGLPWE
jgi:hypothetical protein